MVSIFYNDPYNPGYIYSGEWLNNQMDGHGTMDFGEHKYVGEWHDNAMEGEGMFYFANGYKYEGEFQLNQFQGEGTYYDPQGNIVFKGRWDESVPQKRFSDYRFITKLSRILITIFVFLVIMSKLISRHRAIKDKSNEKSA
nr:hypothetical protein [Anaerosolibacter carboniphilus]